MAKFPYEFADPKRWDIIVFKYPGDATMNYIKRLVGLPGETIRIHDGDLWIRKPDQPEGHFEIARKPPEKLWRCSNRSTITIWRRRSRANCIGRHAGRPSRDNAWTNKDLSSFEIDDSAKGEAWIRYRHRVPTPEQWQWIAATASKKSGS